MSAQPACPKSSANRSLPGSPACTGAAVGSGVGVTVGKSIGVALGASVGGSVGIAVGAIALGSTSTVGISVDGAKVNVGAAASVGWRVATSAAATLVPPGFLLAVAPR